MFSALRCAAVSYSSAQAFGRRLECRWLDGEIVEVALEIVGQGAERVDQPEPHGDASAVGRQAENVHAGFGFQG